jgi:protein subunit release factor A
MVNRYYKTGQIEDLKEERKEQIGDGGRGHKRRTYRVTDGTVIDHISNKSARLKDILKGKIEKLN